MNIPTISDLCLRAKDKSSSFEDLSQYTEYFITLDSVTAAETLQALLGLQKGGECERTVPFLINRLVASVDMLRNVKFRNAVKSSLPSAISGKDNSYLLAESLCFTLLMEASYGDSCDVEKLSQTWTPVAAFDEDPVICLLSLILHSCLNGEDPGRVSSIFANCLASFNKDSYGEHYLTTFMRLLDQHISSISYLLSPSELQTFSQFLLKYYLSSSKLADFTRTLHARCDLSSDFYDSYYTELFKLLSEECSSFNSTIGESVDQLKCSSKSSALARVIETCISEASSSKWEPSKDSIDIIDALCCNDVVDVCPNQRFTSIFAISLITDGDVFDRTLCALHAFLEVESVKNKLTSSVLKRVNSSAFSVKSLHKAWFKKERLNYAHSNHLVSLAAWVSLSLFGESSVQAFLKLSLKPSTTSIVALATAIEIFCELEELDEDLANTITERLDSVFAESTWSVAKNMENLADIERLTFALRPLQRFCRHVHKIQKRFITISSSPNCFKLAKRVCRGKLNGHDQSNSETYKRVVEYAADFLLFAGYVMNWGKTMIDWEYLISLARVHVELTKKVIVRATNDEIATLLNALPQLDVKDEDISLVLVIARFVAERKSVTSIVLGALDPLIRVLMKDGGDLKEKLRFANTILPLLSGCSLEEDFVGLVLSMVAVIEWRELSDESRLYLVGEVASLMIAVIRSPVGGDRFSVIGAIIGKLINLTHSLKRSSELNETLKSEHERLEHTVASMCHTIVGFKEKFARIAPFVVSECLANDREATLSMHRLLGACDKYSIALLSSTLPRAKKRCFAHLYPQFANINKIVV